MSNESISNKLSELFELFESGALSREEYDQLKAEIISSGGNQKTEGAEEIIQSEISRESEIESSSKEEAIKSTDKPTQSKNGISLWVISTIALVSVVAAFLIFKTSLFSKNPEIESQVESQVEQTVTDIDGNIYTTVKIGSQVWMVENLRTTKYNDGTAIPNVSGNTEWRNLRAPAYCWYNNDEIGYKETYGALYNWYTINSNKLCPQGWHVPTDADWKLLSTYLANYGYGFQDSGDDIAKSLAGIHGWETSSNSGTVGNDPQSNNRSGFSAFASGIRFSNGEFRHSGQNAKWWSSTETSANAAQIRFISWNNSKATSFSNGKQNGFSVRCVKDKAGSYENNQTTESTTSIWDEAKATKKIIRELKKHPEWSGLNHQILGFSKRSYNEKDLMVALTISDDSQDTQLKYGNLSIFVFEDIKGWEIAKKSVGFTYCSEVNEFSNLDNLYDIAVNNFSFLLESYEGAAGTSYLTKTLYAFVNEEFKVIFSISHGWSSNDTGTRKIPLEFIRNNEGYYDIKSIDNDNLKGALVPAFYRFNGEEYVKK